MLVKELAAAVIRSYQTIHGETLVCRHCRKPINFWQTWKTVHTDMCPVPKAYKTLENFKGDRNDW